MFLEGPSPHHFGIVPTREREAAGFVRMVEGIYVGDMLTMRRAVTI